MRTSDTQKGDWFRIVNKDTADDEPTATEVYIYDEIGFWGTSAQDFVKEMMKINTDSIDLHINSPGGEVFDAIAIYNAIKVHPSNVTVYVDALAASAASFIAQAGDSIIMTRNATMMIHDAAGFCYGNAKDMADTANLLDKVSNNVADIYSQNAGGTADEWRALMKEEVWYSAQEAVDAGLANRVMDTVNKDAEKAKNGWNLSIFNHAGRDDAPAPEQVRRRVLNRLSKENTVGTKAQNSNNGPGGETAPDEVPPQEGQAVQEPITEDQTPVVEEPEQAPDETPVPALQPVTNQANQSYTAGSGAVITLLVNGQPISDFQAVQRHITGLETAQSEANKKGRQDFVTTLARDNRITAVQMSSMMTHALSLTDEQWPGFVASWEAAPSQSLLGNHSGGITNGTPAETTKARDEIQILEDVVAYHRKAGKTDQDIQKMDSWKKLQALLSVGNQS